MGSAKSFVKGLAAGAVLGAVAAIYSSMTEKDEKKAKVQKHAASIAKKVAAHAKQLGKMSKAAYGKIVDTTVAEYRGVKALSDDEMNDLRTELKDGWTELQSLFSAKAAPKKKR